ncbi:Zn-ribbon domain-containing OB-fold protein [Variovorax sp. Root411]|uniref:Zn-ribbon domain-containing OB-fold protein n=1 Tax=Variovorax sp. Root411 TaxID=1736530 RepID=UPI001F482B4F|nr:OB-fold domain-containing protein [Variovorax sp. Root411]
MIRASGRGSLHSYIISHLPAPGFEPPYTIAVVKLDEGPKMLTNIVGTPPDPALLELDDPVEVTFMALNEQISLPVFKLVGATR